MNEETFTLYDLKVTLVHGTDGKPSFSKQEEGTYFLMQGENLIFPCGDHSFPLYALAALLPILPAKQRPLEPSDWMATDSMIANPDPYCGTMFLIQRTGTRTFRRKDVTAVSMPEKGEAS